MKRGFLIVDKSSGISSNRVVGEVKKATGIKKVGHAGTLDPLATGALVVAIGKVTRLIRFVQDQPKEYLATAEFGVSTDTLDADGAILNREPMDFSLEELQSVLPRFTGDILQVPPMVSALKRDGKRLYELARQGEVVERDARPVRVEELEIISVGPGPYPEVEFRVVCGKGTYVRSLADDMAGVLGGSAHLTALRRLRIGSLHVDRGLAMDELGSWQSRLIAPVEALGDLPLVAVGDETAKGVGHGMRFVGGDITDGPVGQPYRVVDEGGKLLAVYSNVGREARPLVVLPS